MSLKNVKKHKIDILFILNKSNVAAERKTHSTE